jgi:hypothetical protein
MQPGGGGGGENAKSEQNKRKEAKKKLDQPFEPQPSVVDFCRAANSQDFGKVFGTKGDE